MTEYRVDIEAYNGPLDLLLYLIRKTEIDIYDIPIARVTEQYIKFVEIIQKLDPNIAGDFLVMLASLVEIKSRALLPRHLAEDDDEETFEDPRLELVRQLLAYKAFKDAAQELNLACQVQSLRHPRQPVGLPADAGRIDLEDVSIWSLMNAFHALLEQTGRAKPVHEIIVDDTPVALHAADIVDSLQHNDGSQLFADVFTGRSKIEMIGLFLALLELIRQRRIRITQDELFGPITIHLIDATPLEDIAPAEPEIATAEQPPADLPVQPSAARSTTTDAEEPERAPSDPDELPPTERIE